MLTHFSLFTGIGGADLAAEWAGFESMGQVEWADYPTKVLEKHWPNVPRWRDIHDVGADNVRRIIGEQPITVLSGGFPCQPFSVAGKRKGKDDNRFLWPEMLRVISELKPAWVIGENVNGFVNMGLEDACADLENQGYAVQAFVIPACAVQAWHERKRVFIVAYSKGGRKFGEMGNTEKKKREMWKCNNELNGSRDNSRIISSIFQNTGCELFEGSKQRGTIQNETGKRYANIFERPSEMVSDPQHIGCEHSKHEKQPRHKEEIFERSCNEGQLDIWEFEPNVGRVANGIPSRVDRLKCLGNAIVPQQIYPIFEAIRRIEHGK